MNNMKRLLAEPSRLITKTYYDICNKLVYNLIFIKIMLCRNTIDITRLLYVSDTGFIWKQIRKMIENIISTETYQFTDLKLIFM